MLQLKNAVKSVRGCTDKYTGTTTTTATTTTTTTTTPSVDDVASGNKVVNDIKSSTPVTNTTSTVNTGWTSPCCGVKIGGQVIMFFCQLIISLVIIGFCMYKLIVLEECQDKQIYSSTLTAIMAFWLPSPRLKT